MAFCRHCGSEIPGDSAFCPSCGGALGSAGDASTPRPASAPKRGRGVAIAVAAVVLLLAVAGGAVALYNALSDKAEIRAQANAEDEATDAREERMKAQVGVVADFLAAAMTEDSDTIKACVTPRYVDVLDDYLGLSLPSDPDHETRREWNGDVLALTISNGRDEVRADLQSQGDEEKAEVTADFYFNGGFEQSQSATLEIEGGRWVITEIGGVPIEDWL